MAVTCVAVCSATGAGEYTFYCAEGFSHLRPHARLTATAGSLDRAAAAAGCPPS